MTPAQELHEAIRVGDEARVHALLDSDPALVHGGGAAGMAPLLLAIYTKRPIMAKLLLNRGAKLDVYAAAAMGETEACRQFIKADSLAFVSMDGLYRAMGEAGRNTASPQYCDACFTVDYPTTLTDHDEHESGDLMMLGERKSA